MNNEIKLCRNCKHAKRDWFDVIFHNYQFAKCRMEPRKKIGPDIVTGKASEPNFYYCDTSRKHGNCGVSAKNFEAKK